MENVPVLRHLFEKSTGQLDPYRYQQVICSRSLNRLELSRNKCLQTIHCAPVNHLDIDTTDGRYLLSGAADGSIAIHDLEFLTDDSKDHPEERTYKLVCSVLAGNRSAHKRSIETVQWYPLDSGMFTSSGADRVIKIWDTNRLQAVEEYSFHGIVHCHHLSPVATKHNLIAVGSDSSVVKLIDIRSGSATHSLRGHKEGAVRAVRWSNRDEFLLVTGGKDSFVRLWDVRTASGCLMKLQKGKKKKKSSYYEDTTHNGSIAGVGFSGNGNQVITIATDQKLHLWDVYSGKLVETKFPTLSNIKNRNLKFCIATRGLKDQIFAPTGSSLTSVKLSPNSRTRHMYGHYNSVNCCVYDDNRSQLLSGGNDHKILLWTHNGDRDYEDFLNYKRDSIIEKKSLSEGLAETKKELPAAVAQTLDAWSDDEDSH